MPTVPIETISMAAIDEGGIFDIAIAGGNGANDSRPGQLERLGRRLHRSKRDDRRQYENWFVHKTYSVRRGALL
jgi:hypothetical protein